MDFNVIFLILLALGVGYRLLIGLLGLQSARNPVLENVQDLYDAETYEKWRRYTFEKTRTSLLSLVFLVAEVLVLLSGVCGRLLEGISNVYLQSLAMVVLFTLADTLLSLPLSYYDTFVIEEKYGFNKSTRKTFFLDQLKQVLILTVVVGGLVCLLALIHQKLGDWMLLLFTGVMVLFVAAITFLNPVFSKIFNKFTPLDDGPLKANLTALLEKYGYTVKAIDVMDASRRTTKSNAYFTGFGKLKTIVLYDTLLSAMDADEVCAVFAHEMGHGLHRDTLVLQLFNMLQFVAMSLLLWLGVRDPGVMEAFGFASVNYGLAAMLLMLVELPVVQPLLMLPLCAYSRFAEYRADRQAVRDGYGPALSRALKKLSVDNLSDLSPSPALVVLEYTHPPISQRLAAIDGAMEHQKG